MHVQSVQNYCFSSSNMQICDVLVAVVVVVAQDQRRDCSDDATNFAYLIGNNKSFARPSRAFFNSVHFFQVLGKSATWNDHFSSFTENVNTQAQIWIFFLNVDTGPLNSVPG